MRIVKFLNKKTGGRGYNRVDLYPEEYGILFNQQKQINIIQRKNLINSTNYFIKIKHFNNILKLFTLFHVIIDPLITLPPIFRKIFNFQIILNYCIPLIFSRKKDAIIMWNTIIYKKVIHILYTFLST